MEFFTERQCTGCTATSKARWGCDATYNWKDGEVEWVEDDKTADEPIMLGREPVQEEWWQCPRRPILDDPYMFDFVLKSWGARERGFLPYPGAYLDQPAKLVQAWDAVDAGLAEARRMHDKKRKAMSRDR